MLEKKKVKELEIGEKLELENSKIATIKEISNGFFVHSKLLHYTNGLWSCALNNDTVIVKK